MKGYFLLAEIHHFPGKAKRQMRGLDATNLDDDAVLQLKLQARYGEQGALVVRLASKLQFSGHHIVGDNAFSSVQLASDLRNGTCPALRVPKCDYTGTQVMQKKAKKDNTTNVMHFAEYKNLPTGGWGRIKKYDHEWYCDNDKSVSAVRFHDKKHITLISTVHHGSKMGQTKRTRGGKRQLVSIPEIVKE